MKMGEIEPEADFKMYEELTGDSVEELCEQLEITVDYFMMEFV